MARTQEHTSWYSVNQSTLYKMLNATDRGLTESEAEAGLREYGPNKLPEPPPTSLWQVVLRQLCSPLVYILLVAAAVSFHIGNCRSETKSAFILSPLRSPILLLGAVGALLIHVSAMYVLFIQRFLGTEPLSVMTWLAVIALAVTVVPAIEFHKWWWQFRER
jgi:magnesium-transporting ATPase (P-type)